MQRSTSIAFISLVLGTPLPRRLVVRSNSAIARSSPTTTPVNFKKPHWSIDHTSPLFFLGSCFAETLSDTLAAKKFQIFANNHGILFNPVSLSTALRYAATGEKFDDDRHVFQDKLDTTIYHSWTHHSSFSSSSRAQLIEDINAKNVQAHCFMKQSEVLFLTLGTAFVHELSDSTIVANCHKQPAKLFNKRLLKLEEAVTALDDVLMDMDPRLQVVITVSPVRHTREGVEENSRSKAVLLLTAHELVDKYPDRVRYFPTYELFIDELRDYRWYDADMLHPSKAAKKLVFDIFADTFLSDGAVSATKLIDSIHVDMQHRPLLQKSLSYKRHLERTLAKTQQAQKEHYVDFSKELETLQSILATL